MGPVVDIPPSVPLCLSQSPFHAHVHVHTYTFSSCAASHRVMIQWKVVPAVVTNIDCQLERVWNHLREKALGVPVREYVHCVNGGGKTYPPKRRHQLSLDRGAGMDQNTKAS